MDHTFHAWLHGMGDALMSTQSMQKAGRKQDEFLKTKGKELYDLVMFKISGKPKSKLESAQKIWILILNSALEILDLRKRNMGVVRKKSIMELFIDFLEAESV